jgi:hypothetical protein
VDNALPDGMMGDTHAVPLASDLSDIEDKITAHTLEIAFRRSQRAAVAMFECADRLRQRTALLTEWTQRLIDDGEFGRIRQRAAFSSFSIPSRGPANEVWEVREGNSPRSHEVRALLRKERDLMERHAREAGCDLIVDPYVHVVERQTGSARLEAVHAPRSTRVRLEILRDFLQSMPDDKIRVVFQRGKIDGSFSSVGDWFFAEAVVPRYLGGYRKTIFTEHGPTVLSRIEEFDRELRELLDDMWPGGQSSREVAISTIGEIIEGLDTQP